MSNKKIWYCKQIVMVVMCRFCGNRAEYQSWSKSNCRSRAVSDGWIIHHKIQLSTCPKARCKRQMKRERIKKPKA